MVKINLSCFVTGRPSRVPDGERLPRRLVKDSAAVIELLKTGIEMR